MNIKISILTSITVLSLLLCHALAAQPLTLAKKTYTRPWGAEFEGEVAFSFQQLKYNIVTLGADDEVVEGVSGDQAIYSFRLAPAFGIFLVKGFQAGIQPLFIYSQVDFGAVEGFEGHTEKEMGGGLDVFLRYIVDTRSAVFPFLGFSLGGIYGKIEKTWADRSFDLFEVGPQLGMKFVIGGRGILTVSFSYRFQSFGLEGADSREGRHEISLGTGLGFWI